MPIVTQSVTRGPHRAIELSTPLLDGAWSTGSLVQTRPTTVQGVIGLIVRPSVAILPRVTKFNKVAGSAAHLKRTKSLYALPNTPSLGLHQPRGLLQRRPRILNY